MNEKRAAQATRMFVLGVALWALPSSAADAKAFAGLSVSVDRGAAAVSLGGRLSLGSRWTLGLDAEWNPWMDLISGNTSAGAANAYASARYQWKALDDLSLHSSVKVGTSVLLFDVVGAPAGSVGVFVGASLLGVSFGLGNGLCLLVEPLEMVAAIPHLKGVPFAYRQYRASVGLEVPF